MAQHTDVVVIGAGQAGLAMSRCLTDEGIAHVVLERGAIAQRWRHERWDSLRLLTPNWMTRLPGHRYRGDDPDGFMTKAEVSRLLGGYARSFDAPVRAFTEVEAVRPGPRGYVVEAGGVAISCRAVVVATGACQQPKLPDWSQDVAGDVHQLTTHDYKAPRDVPEGGVLVVGASATGVQLAEELQRAGRQVTLCAGSHVPVPRIHRGLDVMAWMDAAGILSERRAPDADPARALAQPSLQLVGGTPPRDVGLGSLQALGVRVVSRAVGGRGHVIRLSGTLSEEVVRGRLRRNRLLARIDAAFGLEGQAPDAQESFLPGPDGDARGLELRRRGIRSILWATGFRRDYSWLRLPVLDAHGELRQVGGVTEAPGLYALGLPFMRRRNSTFIDGVGDDAAAIAGHICHHLGHVRALAA